MKIIFIGDIVGKLARETVTDKIPHLKQTYLPDLIIKQLMNNN